MRHAYLKLGLGLAFGLAFSGCILTADSLKTADEETQQPATAATVVGVWRTNIPVTTTSPPTDVKVTMQVNEAGTMLLSQRVATGQPSPYDFVEILKENWTWKIEGGKMLSVKTTCEYKNPETMAPTGEVACRTPLTKEADINVKGNAWTVVDQGQPIIFRKD